MSNTFYRSNGRIWYHPSVLKLMDEVGNSGSPEQAIIRKAHDIVRCAKTDGWSGPPFDPSILASLLGIKKTPVEGIVAEAQIVSLNDQFELMFRCDVAAKRLNFTLCHEIAHTLFPDCAQMIHFRNTNKRKFDPEREVEFLCDIGAAELLLPSPFFEADLRTEGVSLRSVEALSDKYNASREAVIRRIPSTNLEPCAVVYLGLGFNREQLRSLNNPDLPFQDSEIVKPRPRLRIRKVHASETFKVFLPGNKSIPDTSKLYDLLTGEEYLSTTEDWNIAGFGRRSIEAIRLYSAVDFDRLGILALVH